MHLGLTPSSASGGRRCVVNAALLNQDAPPPTTEAAPLQRSRVTLSVPELRASWAFRTTRNI